MSVQWQILECKHICCTQQLQYWINEGTLSCCLHVEQTSATVELSINLHSSLLDDDKHLINFQEINGHVSQYPVMLIRNTTESLFI